jgi:hypothetical protein
MKVSTRTDARSVFGMGLARIGAVGVFLVDCTRVSARVVRENACVLR